MSLLIGSLSKVSFPLFLKNPFSICGISDCYCDFHLYNRHWKRESGSFCLCRHEPTATSSGRQCLSHFLCVKSKVSDADTDITICNGQFVVEIPNSHINLFPYETIQHISCGPSFLSFSFSSLALFRSCSGRFDHEGFLHLREFCYYRYFRRIFFSLVLQHRKRYSSRTKRHFFPGVFGELVISEMFAISSSDAWMRMYYVTAFLADLPRISSASLLLLVGHLPYFSAFLSLSCRLQRSFPKTEQMALSFSFRRCSCRFPNDHVLLFLGETRGFLPYHL